MVALTRTGGIIKYKKLVSGKDFSIQMDLVTGFYFTGIKSYFEINRESETVKTFKSWKGFLDAFSPPATNNCVPRQRMHCRRCVQEI